MIVLGAKINSYFEIHKGILLKLKWSLWDIKKRYYLLESKTSFNSKSIENLMKWFQEKNLGHQQREAIINEVIESIDLIIEKIDYEKRKWSDENCKIFY